MIKRLYLLQINDMNQSPDERSAEY